MEKGSRVSDELIKHGARASDTDAGETIAQSKKISRLFYFAYARSRSVVPRTEFMAGGWFCVLATISRRRWWHKTQHRYWRAHKGSTLKMKYGPISPGLRAFWRFDIPLLGLKWHKKLVQNTKKAMLADFFCDSKFVKNIGLKCLNVNFCDYLDCDFLACKWGQY